MAQVIGEVFGGGHQVDCQQAVVRRLAAGQPGQGAAAAIDCDTEQIPQIRGA
jgi:hypothetical protein